VITEFSTNLTVSEWLANFPAASAVFEEFAIHDEGAATLKSACLAARADELLVRAKLQVLARQQAQQQEHAEDVEHSASLAGRPMTDWLAISPPGWISQQSAGSADPLAIAQQIQELGQAVVNWSSFPDQDRWDTFQLQSLSAALFNRYANRYAPTSASPGVPTRSRALGLLQLDWPPGCDAVRCCVAEMQQMLVAPLAVYKAVRIPLEAEHYPTPVELSQAESFILAQRDDLSEVVTRLARALRLVRPSGSSLATSVTPAKSIH
jgi:hypothetical protein